MNNIRPYPHMPPGPPIHPSRRQNEYHYAYQPHHPQQMPYPSYPHQPQYHPQAPPPQYMPQWYGPYSPYPPPMAQQQQQQQQQQQPQRHSTPHNPQSPLVVSSNPYAQPALPVPRQSFHTPQPVRTPFPEQSTPSTVSQAIVSPSTTPTSASINMPTPPVTISKSNALASPELPQDIEDAATVRPQPFSLPWYSVPDSEFPPKLHKRRRKRKENQLVSSEPEFPSRLASLPVPQQQSQEAAEQAQHPPDYTPADSAPPSDVTTTDAASSQTSVAQTEQASTDPKTSTLQVTQPQAGHKRSHTRPIVPVVPNIPIKTAASIASPLSRPVAVPETAESVKSLPDDSLQNVAPPIEGTSETPTEAPSSPEVAVKVVPKSWADLVRSKNASAAAIAANGAVSNGLVAPKGDSLAEALRSYDVGNEGKVSFLEPRGLVNTGNMCYMNSVLQVLVFCVPFFEFLDQVSKRAVHQFKSDTPLVEAMIMFMREYNVIDSAVSVEQLRLRLKDSELEQYGDAFIPEYVYDVIRRLPRFSTMRRGHQQDAEEFLGFLLEGLHDECVQVMRKSDTAAASSNVSSVTTPTPSSPSADGVNGSGNEAGWLEVGPKQKAAITRSSGFLVNNESPVTKIFGGKLRSEFRVPGLKNSVTLEPYQPLQLDIGDAHVNNITDALKGLTRSETIHGDFNSPRGPGQLATKQVFIETLPPVLILHLKRFQYDNAGGTQKIWKRIGYPLELEIPREVFAPSKRAQYATRPQGLPKYRLISVVYHHGKNASGGHYTVDVRRQEGREWIRLDDTVIRRVRSEDVAGEGGEEEPRVLAQALEQHKRDESAGRNMYSQAGFGDEEAAANGNGEGQEGWSQVNGAGSMSPPTQATNGNKKWAGVVNGTGSATPTTGKQTPRDTGRTSVKDNKVAYILFYQQIRV